MPFIVFNWSNVSNRLHYGVIIQEVLKLAFQYGKENGVVMPESWVKNECAGNMAQWTEETS